MSASVPAARRTSSRLAERGTPVVPGKTGTVTTATTVKKRPAPNGTEPSKKAKAKGVEADVVEAPPKAAPTATTSSSSGKSSTGGGKLRTGDKLPAIKLSDDSGEQIDVSTLTSSVIFTYPKANTGGCTTQACLFRDQYADWQQAGFSVFGLSNDGITSLRNWKEKKAFPYALLSDPARELIGVLTGSKTSTPRSHFVIDKHGKLALTSTSVKPAASSPDALKFAQTL